MNDGKVQLRTLTWLDPHYFCHTVNGADYVGVLMRLSKRIVQRLSGYLPFKIGDESFWFFSRTPAKGPPISKSIGLSFG